MNLYQIRQKLHQIPELAYEEKKTQSFILELFKNEKKLKTHLFPTTGILFEYKRNEQPYLLFRADMDALPIAEETGCEFTSKNTGIMHACGHDIHMTILIGLIKEVLTKKPDQNILFLFQPAEEGHGGAKTIINTGIFNNFSIEAVFALHITGKYPTGTIASKSGIIFGIPQEFDINITGKSSHVAMPQNGKDAFLAGIDFYQSLSLITSKAFSPIEPVVFHVGYVQAGTMRNSLPAQCIMQGTTRTLTKENQLKLNQLIENTAKAVALKYDQNVEVGFPSTYDPVVNHPVLNQHLKNICGKDIQFIDTQASMTGEDFGFFTSLYPGLLFWLGTNNSEDLHSSTFLPDQNSITIGIKLFTRIIELKLLLKKDFLKQL